MYALKQEQLYIQAQQSYILLQIQKQMETLSVMNALVTCKL